MDIIAFVQLWKELRGFIDPVEMESACEALINVLIENDFEVEEIMTSFKRDPEVMDALKGYYDVEEEESDEDWEDEDSEDEGW